MAPKKRLTIKVITPPFRVSYPNVFVPRLNELKKGPKGEPVMEYSVQALFKKGEDLSALEKAIHDVKVATWGPDEDAWPYFEHEPLKPQGKVDKKTKKVTYPEGHVEGALQANFKSQKKPGLVDQNRQPIIAPEDFYGGCYARAQVNVSAYETGGNSGVSVWLENLQKIKDGESLGGRMKAEDAFEAVAGEEASADDVSAGM